MTALHMAVLMNRIEVRKATELTKHLLLTKPLCCIWRCSGTALKSCRAERESEVEHSGASKQTSERETDKARETQRHRGMELGFRV